METTILWVVFTLIVGHWARNRSRNPLVWIIISLILTPVVGALLLFLIDAVYPRRRPVPQRGGLGRTIVIMGVTFMLIGVIKMADLPEQSAVMIALPSKSLGKFETPDAAMRCGELLGRVVECGLPRHDRNRLISYCTEGMSRAGVVDQVLLDAFLNGTKDGQDNVSGWSCASVGKTLTSPMLPRS
jgi:hypothetical protein